MWFVGGSTSVDNDPEQDGEDGSSFISPDGEIFMDALKGNTFSVVSLGTGGLTSFWCRTFCPCVYWCQAWRAMVRWSSTQCRTAVTASQESAMRLCKEQSVTATMISSSPQTVSPVSILQVKTFTLVDFYFSLLYGKLGRFMQDALSFLLVLFYVVFCIKCLYFWWKGERLLLGFIRSNWNNLTLSFYI